MDGRPKAENYDGQHDAIIDQELWDRVQQVRIDNGSESKLGTTLKAPSLLIGLLTDPDGFAMTPSHASKQSRRYRYYVTRQSAGQTRSTPWRVPAGELDRLVIQELGSLLQRRAEHAVARQDGALDHYEAPTKHAKFLHTLSLPEQRRICLEQNLSVRLSETSIAIAIGTEEPTVSELPARLVRRGYELRLPSRPSETSR